MNHSHSERTGNDGDEFRDEPIAMIASDFFRNGILLSVVIVQVHENIPDDFPEFQNLSFSFTIVTSEDVFREKKLVIIIIVVSEK